MLDLHQYDCASLILGNCSLWQLISQHCGAEERGHIPQLESKPLPNAALDAVGCQFHKGPGLCRAALKDPFLHCKVLWLPQPMVGQEFLPLALQDFARG